MSQNSVENELKQCEVSFLNYFSPTSHGQIQNSVFSQINNYLKDILATRSLKPPYENETKTFLEDFSADAINQILKTSEKSKSILKQLQAILSNYTKILSIFITEDYPQFINAAKSIVTQKSHLFFRVQSSPFNYGYTETSPFFYENIKEFTKPPLIENITNFYTNIINNQTSKEQQTNQTSSNSFNLSQAIRICSLLNPFSKLFDKTLLNSLLVAIITSYENWIQSLNVESLKTFDDDELNTFNNLLFLLTANNSELKTHVVLIELSFNLKLFQTFLLRLQFKALKSIYSDLNKTYLQTKEMTKFLKKHNFINLVIDQKDMHHQLVCDFVSIFVLMIRNKDAGIDEIRKFWILSTSQHLSVMAYFFKSWSTLFYSFREDLYEPFFSMVVEVGQFPEESLKFLRKVAHKAKDQSKILLFNTLREKLNQNQFDGDEDLVVSLLCLFIPVNDESFCLQLQNECITKISHNESINIALPLFKSSCTNVSTQKAREYFDAILKSMLKENLNVSDYFDLLLKILKNMENQISEDEFNDLKKLIGPLLNSDHFNEACEFLTKLINLQYDSISQSAIYEFFQLICKSEYFNSDSFNFIKQLFEKIDTKNVDNKTKTSPVNFLWELYINNEDCPPLCDYIIGLFEFHPKRFIEKCFETISQHENGSLKLLSKFIHFIEDGLDLTELGIDQNHFYDDNDYYNITLKGDLDLTLKVIKSISYRSFLQRISRLIEKDPQTIRIKNAETYINSNNFHLDNSMTLTISTSTTAYISYVEAAKYMNPDINMEKLPSMILMEEKFSTVLFDLLQRSTNDLVLEILNQIQPIKSQMDLILNNPNELPWSEIMSLQYPNLFLYRLNIIGNLIQQNNMNWIEMFFKSDALISYLKIVLSNELFNCFSENILILIFKITLMIITIDDFESELQGVISSISSDAIPILLDHMSQFPENHKLVIDILSIFKLFIASNLQYIENNDHFIGIIKTMLFSPATSIRKEIGEIIGLLPIDSQTNILVALLPIASIEKCNEYFVLLKNIASQTNEPLNLIGHLIEMLYSRYHLPNKNREGILQVLEFVPPKQHFSSGLFSVLYTLLSKIDGLEKEKDLLQFLSDNILFNCLKYYKPTSDLLNIIIIILKRNPDVGEFLLRKLKLLTQYNCEYNSLVAQLTDDYKKAWKSHPKHSFSPSKLELTSTPRARGLINLGATCYMNSTIQQLFNITELREKILKTHFCKNVPQHHHHDPFYFNYKSSRDWIEEFQYLFAELSYFPAKALDTLPFVSKWKGWDGETINPREQQDAVEFLQMLLERLEEKEKGLTSMFRGQIIHHLIGRNVDFASTSTEDFLTLSLEVKNHSDIQESLKTFLVPDRFEGQNGYHIEGQGMIDADLYHKIKTAPHILIIQLKRFEYNLSTNARVKVNSEYHFPLELDLTPVMDDSSHLQFDSTTFSQNEMINNNLYELVGVLMHMGSATAGHYYSHVKRDNGEWLTLNDQHVKKCRGENLPMTAAGGRMNYNYNSIENDTNAYILFYRKTTTKSISMDTFSDKISSTISISDISHFDKTGNDVPTSELVKDIENGNCKLDEDESSSNKNTDNDETSEVVLDDSVDKICLCRLVSDIRHIISSSIVTSETFSSLVMELCSSGQISDGEFLYDHFINTLRRCFSQTKDQTTNSFDSQLTYSIVERLMILFEKDSQFAAFILNQQNQIDEFLISHQNQEIRTVYSRLLCSALSTYKENIESAKKQVLVNFSQFIKTKLESIMNYYSTFNEYFQLLQKLIQVTIETVHIDGLDCNSWSQTISNFLATTIPAFAKSHSTAQLYESIDLSIVFILASLFSIDFSTIEPNLSNWSLSLHHSYQLIIMISDQIKNNEEKTNLLIEFTKNKPELSPSLMSLIFIVYLYIDDEFNKVRDDSFMKILSKQMNMYNFLSKSAKRAEDFNGKLAKRFIDVSSFLVKTFLFDLNINAAFETVVYAIFSNGNDEQLTQFMLIVIDNKKLFENSLLKCPNNKSSPAQSFFRVLSWIIKQYPELKSNLTPYRKDLIGLLKKCSSNELTSSYQACFNFIYQNFSSNPSEFFGNISSSPSSQNLSKFISSVPSAFLTSNENIRNFISFVFPLNCEQDLFYTKSDIFKKICLNGFSDWSVGTDLSYFIIAKITSTIDNSSHNSLHKICSLLWDKQVFERNISYNCYLYIQLSWTILKKYPQSSQVFYENHNYEFLYKRISSDVRQIRHEMLLRPKLKLFALFTNAFISSNKGKKYFMKGNKCDNLIKKYKKDLNISLSSVFSIVFYTNFPSSQCQTRKSSIESFSSMCNSVSCPNLNNTENDSNAVSKSKSISNLVNANSNMTKKVNSNSGKGGLFHFLSCMINIDSDYWTEINQLVKKESRPIITYSQLDSQIPAAKFVVLVVKKQVESNDFITASKLISKELFSLSEFKERSFKAVDIICQQLKAMIPEILKNSEIISKIVFSFNNLYRIANNILMYSFSVKEVSFLLVDTTKVQCERNRWCENAMRIVSMEIAKIAKFPTNNQEAVSENQFIQLNKSIESINIGLEYILDCCKKFNLTKPQFSASQKQLQDALNKLNGLEKNDVVNTIQSYMHEPKA